jgi:Na+-driven multidrug efflux pump
LNILWIPKWGIQGAAWATVISYLSMFIITIFVYGKMSGNKIKDIILFQKSDFEFYKNILLSMKDRLIR